MEQLELIVTEHCGLCRQKFPPARLYGIDSWQSDFRAILSFNLNGESCIETTNLATFGYHVDVINVTLMGDQPPQTVTIIRNGQYYEKQPTDQTAFCFHDWCYKVLQWRVGVCTKSVIYKLVRSLSLEYTIWENIHQGYTQTDNTGNIKTLASNAEHSSSNLQPLSILKLPAELRKCIWEYVGLPTAYSVFILVAGETTRLARSLNSIKSRTISLRKGCRLSVNMISIFGTEYIQDFENKEASETDSGILGVVKELRFAASLHGICAIKILGIDWSTDWLGKIPEKGHIWYGVINGMVSSLSCRFNGLNCTNISSLESCSINRVFWDQSDVPLSLLDPDAALFDIKRDFLGFYHVDKASQQRFFRYMSLFSNNEYARSLTVYISWKGIVGLEAHFTGTLHLSGSREGCTIHFPLHPSERIAYVWLRVVYSDSPAFTPALVIQTTRGRVQTFGPHILPDLVLSDRYRWILLKSKGCVSGFYYENPSSRQTITRFGITCDSTPLSAPFSMPQYAEWGFPSPPIAGPNAGLFLSVAVLSDLERVELCRVARGCTGLLIHYLDGQTAVLGQWHTSPDSQHLCIFDSNGPGVDVMYLGTTKFQHYQIVTDVGFCDKNKVSPGPEYQRFNIGQHIAWWFSEFYDTVSLWEGEILDIPEESKILQK